VTGHVVENWRLIAQSMMGLADHLSNASGSRYAPVIFANLPAPPTTGTIMCVSDSTVNTWGSVIAGGGTFIVLAFYNGTAWRVIG